MPNEEMVEDEDGRLRRKAIFTDEGITEDGESDDEEDGVEESDDEDGENADEDKDANDECDELETSHSSQPVKKKKHVSKYLALSVSSANWSSCNSSFLHQ